MRVLILAEDCNPYWPSLPVVGYKYACSLSKVADVVVATQIRNKPNIEKEGMANAEVIYFDTERIAAPLYKLSTFLRGGISKGWTLQMAMNYPSYLAFEWSVWQHFRHELKSKKFGVIHRVTPMSPTIPSPLAQWSPVPFILGPLNGGLRWPRDFTTELKREREWLSYLRKAYRFLPFYHSTYNKSATILAAFQHTIADLPQSTQSKVINFPEVGIDPEIFNEATRPQRERMTILFVGRLVPYKLPEVVVQAFAKSKILQQHQLLIVGEGPERSRLEELIQKHNLAECVKLTGLKSQAEVGELMREAEILAFPSIRELGAGVVVEAMACGMTCVVVDYGAPADLIDSDRGRKVSLGNLEHLVNSYTQELEALVGDPEKVQRLGMTAHHHALEYYAWDAKARKTLEVYDYAQGSQEAKPDFWE